MGLYDELSAYDNLDFYGKLYDCAEEQRKKRTTPATMLGLSEKRNVAAGTFSKGMKQELAIARSLVHDPQLLIMDEPTADLDPEASKTVRDFILDLKREKRTIFLNTHNLDEAQRICDRIAILNTRLMAVGTPQELERSVAGRRGIQLDHVNDAIMEAVKRLPLGDIAVEGNKLTVNVTDPEKENPMIVDVIVRAGGGVQTVTVVGSTLEDAYLGLVRQTK